jgi:phage pi2 protein 07
MIRDNIVPDQKVAVGKLEYKEIIENSWSMLTLLFAYSEQFLVCLF